MKILSNLEGWRTVIVAALVLVYAILNLFGIVVPEDTQQAITLAVVGILMGGLRLITTGPVGGGTTPKE